MHAVHVRDHRLGTQRRHVGDVIDAGAERHHPFELLAAAEDALGIEPEMRAEGDEDFRLADMRIELAELVGARNIERRELATDEIVAALRRRRRQHRQVHQDLRHPMTASSMVLNSAALGR